MVTTKSPLNRKDLKDLLIMAIIQLLIDEIYYLTHTSSALYCFLKATESLLVLAYPSFSAISAMDKLLPDSKTSECSNRCFRNYVAVLSSVFEILTTKFQESYFHSIPPM